MSKFKRIIFWFCAAVLWNPCVVIALPSYAVVPIRPPAVEGARYPSGGAINDLGQVLGGYARFDQAGIQQGARVFVYSDGAGSVEIPAPASWSLGMGGINNRSQVAVWGGTLGSGQMDAYRYSAGAGFEPLGSFGGTRTEADDINNSGQVTGFSETADGRLHAFRYTDGVGLENMGTSFSNSRGYAINDRGWVAGYGDGNAVIFRDEGDVVLLPGVARGINEAGNVVGNTGIVPGHPTAFVYLNGQMLILGDNVFGEPALYDINNQNVAVGVGYVGSDLHPLLWSEVLLGTEPAGLVDLNTLIAEDSGWTLVAATAINDADQITGWGIFNGEFLGYRLDPIPEPSTWLLFGFGSLALWGWRRLRLRA